MINIQTYLGRTNLNPYFEELLSNSEKFFFNINDQGSGELLNSMLSKNKGIFVHGTIYIQINNIEVSAFVDWDDLDLMWTALLSMTCDYIDDGIYGESQMFTNGLEWSIKKIKSSPADLILFSTLRNYPIFDSIPNLPVLERVRASCEEKKFLKAVEFAATNYIAFRDNHARSHNLIEAKRLLKMLKYEMNINN
jgi:hypothetical protein